MAGETPITVVGNLTADPELRFTPSGAAVANFTVASTPRQWDKQANDFKDGETLFMRCSVWREAAEHVSESLHRGDRVIATGRLVSRSWQTQEGENRTVMEMQVDEVGPSMRYATATVTKAQRGGGSGGGWQGGGNQSNQGAQQGGQGGWGGNQAGQSPQQGGGSQGGQSSTSNESDPWATGGANNAGGSTTGGQGGQSGGSGWGGAPSYDEPPF